jgi:transcriptional regulator with XRE-family HTH domain
MTLQALLKNLGLNISKARKNNLLTQRQIAEGAQITYRYFQSIEAGEANITLATLHKLASYLKVPVHELVPRP